jgi:hyaluronoglucosaminidase
MRKELLLLGAFGMLTTATLCAQEFHLQPTPQEYITQKDSVDIPRQYQILSGNSVQDGPALPLLIDAGRGAWRFFPCIYRSERR